VSYLQTLFHTLTQLVRAVEREAPTSRKNSRWWEYVTTSYEYTKVGRITNPKGLKKAAGKKSVTVSFSKKKVIRLSKKKLTLEPGQVKTIKLKGASAKKVKWSTSNKKVATVSKGKITAKKPGKVTITAKYKKKKYKCKVLIR